MNKRLAAFVVTVSWPAMRTGEVRRTCAPRRTPPWASLTVPMSAPVRACAARVSESTPCVGEQQNSPRNLFRHASSKRELHVSALFACGSIHAWRRTAERGASITI
jgi:hypothetical protein